MKIFILIDHLFFFVLVLTALYLLVFAVASHFNRNNPPSTSRLQRRFIVLVTAHKKDRFVLQCVNSILGQTYPQRMFDVVVISDHESEMTNMQLAQQAITLLTPDFSETTKAKMLQYAILNLPEFKIYDCVVVLNATNIVEPEFLEQINNAYDSAGTKAIQTHKISKNRDTSAARLDATFEEINNNIFRKGHLAVSLSAALNDCGTVFDFTWFKANIMKIRTSGEDKELEAMLVRQNIYVDYFEDIYVYDEKTRTTRDFNYQRGRWAFNQFHALASNIRYLPRAVMGRRYDLIDKILQWMLVPRTIMMGIILLMSLLPATPLLPFAEAYKWWGLAAATVLSFAIATPNYLVDDKWDRTFLMAPIITIWGLLNMFKIGKYEADEQADKGKKQVRKLLRKL